MGKIHGNAWKGGRYIDQDGYVCIRVEGYRKNGYAYEHLIVAEEVYGNRLPQKVVIHHIDENRSNNKNNNLVICENLTYHLFLHRRMKAISACGHADWRKCVFCGVYSDESDLTITKTNRVYHKKCNANYERFRKYLRITDMAWQKQRHPA